MFILFVLNLILNSSVPGLRIWGLMGPGPRSIQKLVGGISEQVDPVPSLLDLEVAVSDSGARASSSSLEVAGATSRGPISSLAHCCLAAGVCN